MEQIFSMQVLFTWVLRIQNLLEVFNLARLKPIFYMVFSNLQWLIGNDSHVNFWSSKWLEDLIVNLLGIEHISDASKFKVSDIIVEQKWSWPLSFQLNFPVISNKILAFDLPLNRYDDQLIWKNTNNGYLSFQIAIIQSDLQELLHHRQKFYGKIVFP